MTGPESEKEPERASERARERARERVRERAIKSLRDLCNDIGIDIDRAKRLPQAHLLTC